MGESREGLRRPRRLSEESDPVIGTPEELPAKIRKELSTTSAAGIKAAKIRLQMSSNGKRVLPQPGLEEES
jgi:hypothetical protein